MGKPIERFVVGTVVTGVGLLTGQGWVAMQGLSMALDSAGAMLNKPPRLAIRARNLGDNISDPMVSLPIVYGRMRLGINRVFMETTDGKLYLWTGALT